MDDTNVTLIFVVLFSIAAGCGLVQCQIDAPYRSYLSCINYKDSQPCFEQTIKDKEVFK